jgi:hypothetical protein
VTAYLISAAIITGVGLLCGIAVILGVPEEKTSKASEAFLGKDTPI